MFWIRYQARNAQGQLVTLETQLPKTPTDVDYPERRATKVHVTQDGAVVIQRPLRDARPRKWIWRNYGPRNAGFMDQWRLLESLDVRTRLQAGLAPTVEVWEDVSGIGGFNKTDGSGNRVYTKVTVTQADQTPKSLGYDSVLEFYVTDPSYSAF